MHMNKQYLFRIVWILSGLSILAGCASTRKAAKTISVEAEKTVLTADSSGSFSLDVAFRIPRKYLPTRSRLFITPQLIVDDSLRCEFPPLVVDAPIHARKMKRRALLENYRDPYGEHLRKVDDPLSAFTLEYHTRFDIPEDSRSGFVRAVVSRDGCGECSAVDTLQMARISNPVSLIDPQKALDLSWIEPEFVIRPKIREGKGEARLQFIINRYDINLSLGDNLREMTRMTQTLGPVLTDTLATIRSMSICGMASADGPYGFNTALARNRAAAARQWLVGELRIRPEISRLIRTDSRPEGWWPVYRAMAADGHPDSLSLKHILTTRTGENDDVQEYYIRRLACWPDIRDRYLSKDRKVEYAYSYLLRSFTTDGELLAMYRLRPDAFNEDELLRVAALSAGDSLKTEVYGTLLHYFPQSAVAANNLAVLYLRQGEVGKARQTLRIPQEYTPEMLATLAASHVYENDFERAIELLQEIDLPEARYNLGLLRARQRRLGEAYALLRDYRDVNSAIVALSLGRNAEARKIMDELPDEGPLAEYVRALAAARQGDEASARRHLERACTNEQLRERAAREADFAGFRSSPEGK